MSWKGHRNNPDGNSGNIVATHYSPSAPSEYERKVAADWRQLHERRSEQSKIVGAWRSSALQRNRPITLPTSPFDHRSGDDV